MGKPWVVAHRGASGYAPENTMTAFRKAVELGATFIETDLQLTRDSYLVALHDVSLERTTNGRGSVREHTLEELRALDAGAWFGPQFAGERIPTLKEILEFALEADVVFYLEVKPAGTWGVEHALVNVLREARVAAHTAVLSFDPRALANVQRHDPTLISGLLFDKPMENPVDAAWEVGARQLAPRADVVTAEMVKQAHASGLQVVTWTVNEPADMRRALDAGVDGIMTDYPDRLVSVLKEPAAGA
jgi:glycerophosphoryl diester phosphodiesterase